MHRLDDIAMRLALPAVLLATFIAYAPGLAGPFVLDDHVNLAPILAWQQGQGALADAVLGNGSGPLGRPIAYLSFAANAAVGGGDPWGFKLVNLLLHLATGVLLLLVLRRVIVLAIDSTHPVGSEVPSQWRADLAAFAAFAIWMLHPLQVSTVLYTVQRMTQLSALAQLAALLCYLEGRSLVASVPARARLWLFGAVPAMVLVGAFAKENALVAPFLIGAVELSLPAAPRARMLRWFLVLLVALPLAAGLCAMVAWGPSFAAGYDGREFTMTERLLSQPRVLGEYLLASLWPAPSSFGLYRDGYVHSTGLAAPPATLAWILFWPLALLLAWCLRRRTRLPLIGVLWFLVGHSMEASFIALEPYFEHRNYLPLAGVAIALVAAPVSTMSTGRLRVLAWAPVPVALLLAAHTMHRAWQWGDVDRMLASEGPVHPEVSRRLQVDRAIRAYSVDRLADVDRALDVLRHGRPGNEATAAVWSAIFECDRLGTVSPGNKTALLDSQPLVITHNFASYLAILVRRTVSGRCEGLQRNELAGLIERWVSNAAKPVTPSTRRELEAQHSMLKNAGRTP